MPATQTPTLTEVSAAFDAYDKQHLSFRDLLLIEQDFYLTADAESLATYAKRIGRGRFQGLHPIYVAGRADLKKLSAAVAEFGGGRWLLTDCSDTRGIVKDAEYILVSTLNTTAETKP